MLIILPFSLLLACGALVVAWWFICLICRLGLAIAGLFEPPLGKPRTVRQPLKALPPSPADWLTGKELPLAVAVLGVVTVVGMFVFTG